MAARAKISPVDAGRLLGGVKLAAKKANAATSDLERQIVRAAQMGCSLREIQAAAGFGSHRRVQEVVKRSEVQSDQT